VIDRYRLALVVVLLMIAGASRPTAQPSQAPNALIVSPTWLAEHLHDSDLALWHVGDPAEYAKTHIPGARLVGLYDLSLRTNADGLRLEMMPAEDLRQKLASLGVSDTSRIVLYFDAPNLLTSVTRILFTLDRAGLGGRTSVLDGGLPAWTRAGQPVTADMPPAREAQLSPLTIRPMVVDADFVERNLQMTGYKVIDGRAPAFYEGEQTGGTPEARHKVGHIAHAGSVPFSSVLDEHGQLKSTAELRDLFEQAGAIPGDTIVAYCHIGQQATAAIFAARALGHPVLLYDGSFEDWSRRPNAPVEITKKK
jgi:thiosulfate/3-mercaptopyruvate sulfurtransferase